MTSACPFHSPWKIRFRHWLKQQHDDPFEPLLPPLVDIIMDYSSTETLLIVYGHQPLKGIPPPNHHACVCLSFCPGLDKTWYTWSTPFDIPPPQLGRPILLPNDDSLFLARGTRDSLTIVHHSQEDDPKAHWKILQPLSSHLQDLFYNIVSMVVLGGNQYFLGQMTLRSSAARFVSISNGEIQILTPPSFVLETSLVSVPSKRGKSFENDMDTTLSGVVLILGGRTKRHFGLYNPITNSWRRLSDLPLERVHPLCFLIDDQLFVVGGSEFAQIDCYSLTTHTWSTLSYHLPKPPTLATPLAMHYANHHIYCLVREKGATPLTLTASLICFSFQILNPNATWVKESTIPNSPPFPVLTAY